MITLEQARVIIEQMGNHFDSHEFIREYIITYPETYLEMLSSFGSVRRANGRIAAFLEEKQEHKQRGQSLPIHKQGKVPSINIFGRNTRCERWDKI